MATLDYIGISDRYRRLDSGYRFKFSRPNFSAVLTFHPHTEGAPSSNLNKFVIPDSLGSQLHCLLTV